MVKDIEALQFVADILRIVDYIGDMLGPHKPRRGCLEERRPGHIRADDRDGVDMGGRGCRRIQLFKNVHLSHEFLSSCFKGTASIQSLVYQSQQAFDGRGGCSLLLLMQSIETLRRSWWRVVRLERHTRYGEFRNRRMVLPCLPLPERVNKSGKRENKA